MAATSIIAVFFRKKKGKLNVIWEMKMSLDYPLVNMQKARKLPFIVSFPIKHGDFP